MAVRMAEDVMRPIPGLSIMAASDENRARITDAGPPVDTVVLLAWTAASVASFLVFGVLRPLVGSHEATGLSASGASAETTARLAAAGVVADTLSAKEEKQHRLWVIRQMFSTVWSWLLADLWCRLLSYVFLPPTMLWRRKMLPLPQATPLGNGEWINKARLLFLCVPSRSGHGGHALPYFLLGGFFRDVAALTSADALEDADLAAWAARCDVERHWKLPVSGVRHRYGSPAREAEYDKLRQFHSEAQRTHEVRAHHTVVVVTVLCCCAVTISVYHFIITRLFPVLEHRGIRAGGGAAASEAGREERSAVELSDEEEEEAEVAESATNGSRRHAQRDYADTDDSWPTSPEAEAEEARRRAMDERAKQERQAHEQARRKLLSVSGMTLTVQECWPTLLGCVYAGMFAYVGGSPILMQYLYPGLIIISSLLAMVFSG